MGDKTEGKLEKKQEKKLKKFLDLELSLPNRFKYLVDIVEKCSDQELSSVFTEHSHEVYDVFLETFNLYEAQAKKAKYNDQQLASLQALLSKMLSILSGLVKQRWQVRNTANFLEKLLVFSNKHATRFKAFESLLQFYDALGEPEEEFLRLLPASFDFQTLADEGVAVPLKHEPLIGGDRTCFLPRLNGATRGSKEETFEMFSFFLEFISRRLNNFDMWFKILRTYFLTIFFPNICKDIGLIDKEEKLGFNNCPHDIMVALFTRLELWMQSDAAVGKLWGNEQNSRLLLEIFRQSTQMPFAYRDTVIKYINLYHKVLVLDPPKKITPENLHKYRNFFFQKLPFSVHGEATANADFSMSVLHIYRVIKSFEGHFDEDLTEVILTTLAQLTTKCLVGAHPEYEKNLLPIFMDTMLSLWIKSRTTNIELWQLLQKTIGSFLSKKDAVAQLQLKILPLTVVIKDFMYTFERVKRTEERNAGANAKRRLAFPKTPDFRELKPVPNDGAVSSTTWTYSLARLVWLNLIEIFRPINKISDPLVHRDAMRLLRTVIDILVDAHEQSDYKPKAEAENEKQHISVMNVLGPWLFETAELSEKFDEGKAVAYSALCRLICRHSDESVPVDLLAHFYEIVKKGLTQGSGTKVSWDIIRSTSSLFSLAIPGANILVPYYLLEIRNLCSKPHETPVSVQELCILILGSLIPFSRHFGDLEVPVDPEALKRFKESTGFGKTMKFKEITFHLSSLILMILKVNPNPTHLTLCLSSLCAMIFEEIYLGEECNKGLVNEWVETLLYYTLHDEVTVSSAALSSLSTLAVMYDKLHQLDEQMIPPIVTTLCGNITDNVRKADKERTVSEHFFCLRDWLLSAPANFFNDKKLLRTIFQAIERGLTPNEFAGTIAVDDKKEEDPAQSSKRKKDKKDTKKKDAKDEDKPKDDDKGETEQVKAGPYPPVHEAAEAVLALILNFLYNFPNNKRYDVVTSHIHEDYGFGENKMSMYAVNDTIFGLGDIPTETDWEAKKDSKEALQAMLNHPRACLVFEKYLATLNDESVKTWHQIQTRFYRSKVEPSIELWKEEESEAMTHLFRQFEVWRSKEEQTDAARDRVTRMVVREYTGKYAWHVAANTPTTPPPSPFLPAATLYDLTVNPQTQPVNPNESPLASPRDTPNSARRTSSFEYSPNVAAIVERDLMRSASEEKLPRAKPSVNESASGEEESSDASQSHSNRDSVNSLSSVGSGSAPNLSLALTNLPRTDSPEGKKESPKSARKNSNSGKTPRDKKRARQSVKLTRKPSVSDVPVVSLDELLHHLATNNRDIAKPISSSFKPPEQFALEVKEMAKRIAKQTENDSKVGPQAAEPVPDLVSPTEGYTLPAPAPPLGSIHFGRMLAGSLGWIDFDHQFVDRIQFTNTKFMRQFRQFDRNTSGREAIKIGLIYVSLGQEDEREIFANDSGSPLYNEVVRALAAAVDIKMHRGYIGGLDRSGNVGTSLPYYATATTELAVHQITRMPTIKKDPQFILKKRHVGNDYIHVIWSDHCRDYKTSTIVSQFGEVLIIIYPLPNGLFRVQIAKKKGIGHFGPLLHNMTVNKQLLPILVRQTAMNANFVVRSNQEAYFGPIASRKKELQDLVSKFRVDKDFQGFVIELLHLNPNK